MRVSIALTEPESSRSSRQCQGKPTIMNGRCLYTPFVTIDLVNPCAPPNLNFAAADQVLIRLTFVSRTIITGKATSVTKSIGKAFRQVLMTASRV